MKKQVLLFVSLIIGSLNAMAVSLPSSSYSSYVGENEVMEVFSINHGVTFLNQSSANSYEGSCTSTGVWIGDVDVCLSCCQEEMDVCMAENNNDYSLCKSKKALCNDACEYKSLNEPESPLGEVLILLPFALVYALVRRRKESDAEQA